MMTHERSNQHYRILLALPVASKIGFIPWQRISSSVGAAKKFLTAFQNGFGVVVPCSKEFTPGPSVVPAAKLYPIAGRQPSTYQVK